MNFEQLFTHFSKKNLINKSFFTYMKNKTYLINTQKQKLKLGTIAFQIKNIEIMGIHVGEEIDIKFTKQDTTHEDSLKVENRLEALKWKWDFSNILAFLIIIFSILFFINAQFIHFYDDFLNILNSQTTNNDSLVTFTLESLFKVNTQSTNKFDHLNFFITDVLIDMCDYYNILK